MTIEVFAEGKLLKNKFWIFPGGEVGVNIADLLQYKRVSVVARITSSDELMQLAMIADILKNGGIPQRILYLPYIPYARQDRRCADGDSHSLKVAANFINTMGFNNVVVLDPHSHVAEALIENITIQSQADIVKNFVALREWFDPEEHVLVSPDAGALKKIYEVANVLNTNDIVCCSKIRRPSDGAILGFKVENPSMVNGRDVLIVDDICDGGASFVGLAQELKDQGAHSVSLYITHGIFSKGFGVFRGLIDNIFVTDSFHNKFVHFDDINLFVANILDII